MQKFEYMTERAWAGELAELANKKAKEGWRLIQCLTGSEKDWLFLVFERAFPVT